MAIAELVTAEQYLHTSFEHDAEFVEGRIVERPLPTWDHSELQGLLIEILRPMGRRLGFHAVPEQRVRVLSDRYRIPDVCVVIEKPKGQVVTEPPVLCVEILSPDDSASEIFDKVHEYLQFGVPWVWVIDPLTRAGRIHTPTGITAVESGKFFTNRFEVDLEEIHGDS
jgi:Uma2 family endonuclease